MRMSDMKIETPVPLADLDDWVIHADHPGQCQCSDCGVGVLDPWYTIEDVTVVRHWLTISVEEPKNGGGHWTWYCPEHLEKRADRWWKSSHLAPANLLPVLKHWCAREVGLKRACGEPAVEPFDRIWLCEEHAAVERVNRRIAQVLAANDDRNLYA